MLLAVDTMLSVVSARARRDSTRPSLSIVVGKLYNQRVEQNLYKLPLHILPHCSPLWVTRVCGVVLRFYSVSTWAAAATRSSDPTQYARDSDTVPGLAVITISSRRPVPQARGASAHVPHVSTSSTYRLPANTYTVPATPSLCDVLRPWPWRPAPLAMALWPWRLALHTSSSLHKTQRQSVLPFPRLPE